VALNTSECNCLTPLHFKGLRIDNIALLAFSAGYVCTAAQIISLSLKRTVTFNCMRIKTINCAQKTYTHWQTSTHTCTWTLQ